MRLPFPRVMKLVCVFLLALVLTSPVGSRQSGYVSSRPQTYQSPYSFHNFDYNYDYEYGFTAPNETAYLSSANKNVILAAVVPNETDEECLRFIEGMRQEAKRERVGLLVFSAQNQTEHQTAVLLDALEDGMDAFILFPMQGSTPGQEVRRIKRENLPVVSVWDRTEAGAVMMIDAFVGMDEGEFGKQLAAWLAQLGGGQRTVVIAATEENSPLAESCLSRLRIYGKNITALSAGPDTLERVITEARRNGRPVQVVCTDAQLARAAAKQFSGERGVALYGAGEEGMLLALLEEGIIENGFAYSRQREGAAAVAAAVGVVRGKIGPIRVQQTAEPLLGGAR